MQLRKENLKKNHSCRVLNTDICDTGAALEPIELASELGGL